MSDLSPSPHIVPEQVDASIWSLAQAVVEWNRQVAMVRDQLPKTSEGAVSERKVDKLLGRGTGTTVARYFERDALNLTFRSETFAQVISKLEQNGVEIPELVWWEERWRLVCAAQLFTEIPDLGPRLVAAIAAAQETAPSYPPGKDATTANDVTASDGQPPGKVNLLAAGEALTAPTPDDTQTPTPRTYSDQSRKSARWHSPHAKAAAVVVIVIAGLIAAAVWPDTSSTGGRDKSEASLNSAPTSVASLALEDKAIPFRFDDLGVPPTIIQTYPGPGALAADLKANATWRSHELVNVTCKVIGRRIISSEPPRSSDVWLRVAEPDGEPATYATLTYGDISASALASLPTCTGG